MVLRYLRYGNGASIFTTSGVAARKFQTEIEAGQVGCTILIHGFCVCLNLIQNHKGN